MASVTKLVESFSVFEPLDDPRAPNSLHPLLSLIAIAVCATVAGCDSYADIERFAHIRRCWFAEFLDLPQGIPSHDTFSRVFARLDTAQFYLCVQRWLSAVSEPSRARPWPSTARPCGAVSTRRPAARRCTW